MRFSSLPGIIFCSLIIDLYYDFTVQKMRQNACNTKKAILQIKEIDYCLD